MADEVRETNEERDDRWWRDWWVADFSWEGLAKKAISGGGQWGEQSLQDYWRRDPETGEMRPDSDLFRTREVQQIGGRLWHAAHLPPRNRTDRETSWKVETNGPHWQWLEDLIDKRLAAAKLTAGVYMQQASSDPWTFRVSGADRRARLDGAILRGLPQPAKPGRRRSRQLHVCLRQARFVSELAGEHLAFGPGGAFDGAAFAGSVRLEGADFSGPASFNDALFLKYADFSSADFSATASFNGTHFLQPGVFERASFKDTADFDGAVFERAHFDGATFAGTASFVQVTFRDRASFHDVSVAGMARFNDTTFAGIANFERVRFSAYARFSRCRFAREVRFDSAKFQGTASFGQARFGQGAAFDLASFEMDAGFDQAVFSNEATFSSVVFASGVTFSSAAFEQAADFEGVVVTGTVRFDRAAFSGPATFLGTTFSGDASFDTVSFADVANLQRAAFTARAYFANCRWDKFVEFGGWFAGEGSFRNAVFGGPVNFSSRIDRPEAGFAGAFYGARFADIADFSESGPPRPEAAGERDGARMAIVLAEAFFEKTLILSDGADRVADAAFQRGIKVIEADRNRENLLDSLEAGCRTVKVAMGKTRDEVREQRYHRFQIRARQAQKATHGFEVLVGRLYGLAAGYGGSLGRPLAWLGGLILVSGLLYWLWAGGMNGSLALDLQALASNPLSGESWANPAAALGFSTGRSLFISAWLGVSEKDQTHWQWVFLNGYGPGWGFLVRAVAALQSILSGVLIFLFALAVRRRFQIGGSG